MHMLQVKAFVLGAMVAFAVWAWDNAIPGKAASKESVEALSANVELVREDVTHVRDQVDTLVYALIDWQDGEKPHGH